MIVVDSNVVAYYWIRGEPTGIAQLVRRRDREWHVPILWRSEMRNALAGHLRHGTIDEERAFAVMASAEADLIGFEHQASSNAVLRLVARSSLSAYDCEFVALAQALSVPLVTEDRAILKAFPDVALTMEAFLRQSSPATPTAHEKRPRYKTAKPGARRRLAA